MVFKNYYKLLELENNIKSTQTEIKAAYREQAKKYHPDVNVNNKGAEERFKDINEGYRILSDPAQKRKYDKSWYYYVGKKLQKAKSNDKEVKVNDIVNMFFGGNISKKEHIKPSPIKGENIETELEISIKEAFDGTEKKVSIASQTEKNKIIDIKIPSGIKSGEKLRVEGQGKIGKNGGKNGDLIIQINIKNSSIYELKNSDIYVKLLVTPWDAALGCRTSVNGIDGDVTIILPKGTQNGDQISIPNKGYFIENNQRGNLIIKTEIAIPKKLTDEERKLFTELKKVSKFKPNDLVNIK